MVTRLFWLFVFGLFCALPTWADQIPSDSIPPDPGFESSDVRLAAPTQTVPMTEQRTKSRVPDHDNDQFAILETTKGVIVIRLFNDLAPNTVANFVDLVQRGFYNNLTFHRREPGFVIQGGCPNGNGSGNFIDPTTNQPRFLKLEINPRLRHNAPGVVAMARSNHPDSASCQFYITLGAAPHLDSKYAVFGGVVQGLDVVKSIAIGDRIISAKIKEPT